MKAKFIGIIALIMCMISCTTSRTIVSDSVNLDNYKYASLTDVMSYNGSASLMDIEIQVYDIIESTRLEMVGDKSISELTTEQRKQLLLVRFSATQNNDEAIISVNFVDYYSGKPVASCRGAWGLGLDKDGDMQGAIDRVAKQIKKLF